MKFSRKLAGFILLVAVFTVFEWVMLGFNLQAGHPTAFYVVHGILIGVNLLIAAALAVVGVRAWRSSRLARRMCPYASGEQSSTFTNGRDGQPRRGHEA